MATRSSASTGLLVTVGVLGVSTLALFVLTFIFLGQKQTAEEAKSAAESSLRAAQSERSKAADDVRLLAAKLGFPEASSAADLAGRASALTTASVSTVKDRLGQLEKELASVNGQLKAARDDLAAVGPKLDAAKAAREALEAKYATTSEGVTTAVTKFNTDGAETRAKLEAAATAMDESVKTVTASTKTQASKDAETIRQLERKATDMQAQIDSLQRQLGRGGRLDPIDEGGLVDGRIAGVDPSDPALVYLDIGRDQRVVLGLTFEVFGQPSQIKADRDGNYAPGKGALEIVQVGPTSSTARVTRLARNTSLVKGDVIANAMFDPNKTYQFVIAGNFDTRRGGQATPEGASEVRALIEQWGGKVVEELTGEVDFVVLGAKPIVPPEQAGELVAADLTARNRLVRAESRYNDLLKQAAAAKIPVLNLNRLSTLTGLNVGGR